MTNEKTDKIELPPAEDLTTESDIRFREILKKLLHDSPYLPK